MYRVENKLFYCTLNIYMLIIWYLLYLQLNISHLLKLKHSCSTRRNFAWRQADLMFTDEEKLTSNCTGTRGKNQLDKTKLDTIKRHVLQYWPPDGTENEDN